MDSGFVWRCDCWTLRTVCLGYIIKALARGQSGSLMRAVLTRAADRAATTAAATTDTSAAGAPATGAFSRATLPSPFSQAVAGHEACVIPSPRTSGGPILGFQGHCWDPFTLARRPSRLAVLDGSLREALSTGDHALCLMSSGRKPSGKTEAFSLCRQLSQPL